MEILEALPCLTLHGRTVYDSDACALFFNWTCSGFDIRFRGTKLTLHMTALGDQLPAIPDGPEFGIDYPCFGLVAEDGETLLGRWELRESQAVTVWSGENAEHCFRIVKLSENARGKLAVTRIDITGELLKAPPIQKPVMEVVGDSITCGYGNESPFNSMEFKTTEENGWISYGALAARELGYEFSLVSESGINAVKPLRSIYREFHSMYEVYPHTDLIYDEKRNCTPEKWDFTSHPSDIVVLNLGTNDVNAIRFYDTLEEADAMAAHFRKRYCELLRMVRELNGPAASIVCTLGTMDYYLYGDIEEAVRTYRELTGDTNITVFRMIGINMITEGLGSAGHPSEKTHRRMARELVYHIQNHVLK